MLDADLALQALGGDDVAFGHLTTTITVCGSPTGRGVDEKLRAVERIVNGLGFTAIRESVNAVEAWLGSLARRMSTPMSASRSSTRSISRT